MSRVLLSRWKRSFAPRRLPAGSPFLALLYKIAVLSVQLFMLFFVTWQIVGLVWAVQSVPHCSDALAFRMMLVSLVGNLLVGVCTTFMCCFSCVLMAARAFLVISPNQIPQAGQQMRAGATLEEIEAASEVVVYEDGMFEAVEDAKCVVCLSDYELGDELRKLHCNHMFHVDCVDHWLQRKPTCPLCVQSID